MAFQPYFIGPLQVGLERDIEPFLLPADAFPTLTDAYLYRGRIEKRLGVTQLGRLTTFHTITYANVVNPADITYTNTLAFVPISPGSVEITLGLLTFSDDGLGVLSAGVGTSGTIDYFTGVFVINFPAPGVLSSVVVVYHSINQLPCMSLPTQDTSTVNKENLIAFDTRKANLYNNATNLFVDISFDTAVNPISWTGGDADFFWPWNYYTDPTTGNKLLWVTNNVLADGIKYYNAKAYPIPAGQGWTTPTLRTSSTVAGNVVNTCLMIVSYKDRLIFLNTTENFGGATVRNPQRARWSQNGSPLSANAWYDDVPGLGGYIDAPTSEDIVSCQFFKDTLVVFFERSTWQLVYTANEVLPFVWQQINSQFGCESTFSTVPFDRGIFAVGDKAITVADSVNVERIDQKIPYEVFNIHNQNDGPQRVHGVRDYYFQFVYWALPSMEGGKKFPDRVLALNYLEGSYSYYNDSYTCFGYYQSSSDRTWKDTKEPWGSVSGTWSSAFLQADFPSIVAGNQQGFVMIIDNQYANDPSLYISSATQAANCILTSPNHNLSVNQFIKVTDVNGMVELNDVIYKIIATSTNTITLDVDSSAFTAYTNGGFISVINGIDIVTKRFNPFYQVGKNFRLGYFDTYVQVVDKDSTAPGTALQGQFEVEIFVDDSDGDPVFQGTITTLQNYGPNINASKIWQRCYTDVYGQFLQLHFFLSDAQMKSTYIEDSTLVIHALNMWMAPSGNLLSYDEIFT